MKKQLLWCACNRENFNMKAEKLQVFIDSMTHFFRQIKSEDAVVDTPYIHDNAHPLAFDFSGIISITGPLEGAVYVSSETPMLRKILAQMGEPDSSMPLLKDLVGEMANTVAGNARRDFGPEFIISPPVVIDGAPSAVYLPKHKRSYIIPVTFNNNKSLIGICLS